MYKIENFSFEDENWGEVDLFVACLGYEQRSFFLLDKIKEKVPQEKIMVFTMDDYSTFDSSLTERINQWSDKKIIRYTDSDLFKETVIQSVISETDGRPVKIVIDYSSMPRSWYSGLPELFSEKLIPGSQVHFFYSEGEYTKKPEFYSTAGTESYHVISGRSSFRTDRPRTHFIGVGYDFIRTQGLISVLDPEECVILEAYNYNKGIVQENIEELNRFTLVQTACSIRFNLEDIEFMIARLRELINEYYYIKESDIILVPDGPKPLIFVMSMMPWLMGKEGITCLYVTRNSSEVKKEDVLPQGDIVGFKLEIS